MAKLLFLTVGVGVDGDISSGIERLIERENPDKAIFIGSEESRQKVYDPYLSGKELIKRCQPEWHTLTDENNHKTIYEDCKLIMDRYRIQHPVEKNHYVADFTTGTKAMSVGLALAAVAREFQFLSYIYGKREKGRVIPGTEVPISLSPKTFYLDRDLKKVIELFNLHQFPAAAQLVLGFYSHQQDKAFQNKVEFLRNLISGFWQWDLFQFKEANKIFTELTRNEETADLLKALKLYKKMDGINQNLYLCLKNPYSEILAADLFENALRRLSEGKYDDAVARFYRLTEFLAQYILKTEYKIDTDNVDLSQLPGNVSEETKEKAKEILPNPRDGKIQISMEKSYKLLEILGHPIGSRFFNEPDIKELQRKRNYSILAHGFQPIGKEACEKLKTILESYFNHILPKFPHYRDESKFPVLELDLMEKLFYENEPAQVIKK
jgi:CRISPR-associated protein (TIGR02710 family)